MNQHDQDILETCEELRYLLGDAERRISLFLKGIKKNQKHIYSNTYKQSQIIAYQYQQEIKIISLQLDALPTHTPPQAITIIENIREYLRSHLVLFGALITNTDWQSPSSEGGHLSQAGRQTGKIYPTINDYKRDQHWDAYGYEQLFLKHNINALIKFPIHAYTTSSGMSALTTILMYLSGEKKLTGKILCGASSYFQNRWLLDQSFSDQLIYINEANTQEIIKAIDTHHPSVIFLDSLTNSPDIIVPDIQAIMDHLRAVKNETHLIIDNTGLSVQFQPFSKILGKRTNLKLILFESLNKYHQFGMDRVSGGIIVAYGKGTDKLFDYRVHCGTILSDISAASLPTPNRSLLVKRLHRHKRNALVLTQTLNTWVRLHPDSPISGFSYPGIGSYFTIKFKQQYASVGSFKRFVSSCLRIAKRHNVNVTSGTSFGLNTTRVYLTAMRSKPHTPFVRIAVGTESIDHAERLGKVFLEVLEQF
jgi:cystathionine beta-lyase/cystathionine gamma-synthase